MCPSEPQHAHSTTMLELTNPSIPSCPHYHGVSSSILFTNSLPSNSFIMNRKKNLCFVAWALYKARMYLKNLAYKMNIRKNSVSYEILKQIIKWVVSFGCLCPAFLPGQEAVLFEAINSLVPPPQLWPLFSLKSQHLSLENKSAYQSPSFYN